MQSFAIVSGAPFAAYKISFSCSQACTYANLKSWMGYSFKDLPICMSVMSLAASLNARSIGSNTLTGQANAAIFSSALPSSFSWSLFRRYCCPAIETALTVMWFSVIVPVLSTQRIEMEPNASIADGLRAITLTFDMRHAPMAINRVRITGNSSGINAMAAAIPANPPSSQLSRLYP